MLYMPHQLPFSSNSSLELMIPCLFLCVRSQPDIYASERNGLSTLQFVCFVFFPVKNDMIELCWSLDSLFCIIIKSKVLQTLWALQPRRLAGRVTGGWQTLVFFQFSFFFFPPHSMSCFSGNLIYSWVKQWPQFVKRSAFISWGGDKKNRRTEL